jgi:hypothetical protein
LAFGGMVRELFGFHDIALEPSSVQGTSYAANLLLSHASTTRMLGWSPTPHRAALEAFQLSGK